MLEPSLEHAGYWFVSRLYEGGDAYDCTARPIRADWIEETLRHYGLTADPSTVQWLIGRSAGVRIAMETLNAPDTTSANLQRTETGGQAIERMRAQGARA